MQATKRIGLAREKAKVFLLKAYIKKSEVKNHVKAVNP